MSLRESLKKISPVYSLNAAIKARQNTRRLAALYRHYEKRAQELKLTYSEELMLKMLHDRLVKRGIQPPHGPLRIFWVGAHYAQDASGFLQGLEQFGEVITFQNSQGKYGLLGSQPESRRPFVRAVVEANSKALLEQVTAAHAASPIHLVMGQMWANVLDVEALKVVQRLGIPTVNVSMDDKLPELWDAYEGRRMGSVGLVEGLDLVLTTSPDTCLWYMVEGCPAVYWPLASDPAVFYPRPEKLYDVVFVGSKYGLRGELVERLIAAGIPVTAFGPGWPNGSIDGSKTGELFGQARIVLGTGNVGYNKDIRTIKLRDFDAPMSGALYLTHRNPDLSRLFEEDKEIACYETIAECIEKARFYLAHPEKLQAVAAGGLIRARAQFTWQKRLADTLKMIGLLS